MKDVYTSDGKIVTVNPFVADELFEAGLVKAVVYETEFYPGWPALAGVIHDPDDVHVVTTRVFGVTPPDPGSFKPKRKIDNI